MTYDYRGARDRIFGIVRDAEGKVSHYIASPASMSERVLLLALIEFAPNIEPSTESLSLMVGTDERSVRRLLRSCEAKGLLQVEHRTGRRSRYTVTCNPGFTVPPDAESPLTLSPPTPGSESSPPRTLSPPKQTTKAVNEAGKKSTRSRAAQSSLPLIDPKEAAEHKLLTELYFERYESARGEKPPFDGRDGKAIKDLLAKCGPESAAKAIRGAFADDWWRSKVTIRSIAAEPAKFLGLKPGNNNSGRPGRVTQPSDTSPDAWKPEVECQ